VTTPYNKIAVIMNPQSANGDTGRRWPQLRPAIEGIIGPFDPLITEKPGHAADLTRQALKDGCDRIVSVGGDGTHHEVLNGFFEDYLPINPEATLVIMPQGTGSDLARLLGLSRDSDPLRLLNGEHVVRADVGRVTFTVPKGGGTSARYFVNIADFGAGGAVADRVNRHSKALGGFASFLWAIIKTVLTYRPPVIRLQVDGLFVEQKCMDVIVANGQYYGGGIHVAPEAKLNSGKFEVFAIGKITLLDFVRHIGDFYRGDLKKVKKLVKCFSASRIVAHSEERVLVNLDGEIPGELPAAIEILPSALKLVVPAPNVEAALPDEAAPQTMAESSTQQLELWDAAAEALERPAQAAAEEAAPTKYAVIVNPHSANTRTGKRWKHLKDLLKEEIGEYKAFFTERPGHATELAHRALLAGHDRIVCVGGDGTLQEIVSGFFDGEEPINPSASLAVLPEGVASEFTRGLGIHKEVDALALVNSPKTVMADVGRARFTLRDGGEAMEHFINCAHIGLGGAVAERFNRPKTIGGYVSFVLDLLKTLATYRNVPIALEIDGHQFEETCHDIVIANGQYGGGGMLVAPEAELDSGVFEVYVIGDVSPFEALRSLPKIYRGNLEQRPDKVRRFKASRITARATEPVLLSLEGETPGTLPVDIELLPRAIRLVRPEERA
jgi:YegS/Rv2252/BmrU family lipid kinase